MNELGAFTDGSTHYTFHPENRLTLSRADISAQAQAKAANYCGQNIVLETTDTPITDYTRLYLAGGFANYINTRNDIDIGFIPNIDPTLQCRTNWQIRTTSSSWNSSRCFSPCLSCEHLDDVEVGTVVCEP